MTGQELKRHRERLKMTQAQFAAHLGVSQEMVSMMETGAKSVPSKIAESLSSRSSGPNSRGSSRARAMRSGERRSR